MRSACKMAAGPAAGLATVKTDPQTTRLQPDPDPNLAQPTKQNAGARLPDYTTPGRNMKKQEKSICH